MILQLARSEHGLAVLFVKVTWSLVYYFNVFVVVACIVASALFSVMDDLSKIQLQWVVMQATSHLPFTPMLSAGCLHGHLHICLMFWHIK